MYKEREREREREGKGNTVRKGDIIGCNAVSNSKQGKQAQAFSNDHVKILSFNIVLQQLFLNFWMLTQTEQKVSHSFCHLHDSGVENDPLNSKPSTKEGGKKKVFTSSSPFTHTHQAKMEKGGGNTEN